MSIHIISDLHLDEKRPELTRAFFDYLDKLPGSAEALYILGDFFEAWIGDDDDNPFYTPIKHALRRKVDSGTPIFFMHGNRDFLVGKGFELQTGCILIPDPHILSYQDAKYLLMHGDSLCTDDMEYQAFRTQMRNPEVQAGLLAKSLDERREIAKALREKSNESASNKAEYIMDVNPDEVMRELNDNAIDILIHGHTHRPSIHELDNGRKRIVNGDWGNKAWEIRISDEGLIELLDWDIK